MIVCACRTIFIRRCQQKAGIRWSRHHRKRLPRWKTNSPECKIRNVIRRWFIHHDHSIKSIAMPLFCMAMLFYWTFSLTLIAALPYLSDNSRPYFSSHFSPVQSFISLMKQKLLILVRCRKGPHTVSCRQRHDTGRMWLNVFYGKLIPYRYPLCAAFSVSFYVSIIYLISFWFNKSLLIITQPYSGNCQIKFFLQWFNTIFVQLI